MIFWSTVCPPLSLLSHLNKSKAPGIPLRAAVDDWKLPCKRFEGDMWWQQRFSEFVTLFLVINPFGALPTFMEIAETLEPPAQRKLALSATVISFAVLVFFVLAGAFLLAQMGISIRAFQISGGILLFVIALDMIRGQTLTGHGKEQGSMALAVYPLAIPKIAGPGAMLTVVLVTDDDRLNLAGQLTTVGVLALVLAVTFLILLAAVPISRLIGTAGVSVISRVMGMLLAAMAVALVLGAVGDWLNLPKL
jgi:multiple antibiotic resistance protein